MPRTARHSPCAQAPSGPAQETAGRGTGHKGNDHQGSRRHCHAVPGVHRSRLRPSAIAWPVNVGIQSVSLKRTHSALSPEALAHPPFSQTPKDPPAAGQPPGRSGSRARRTASPPGCPAGLPSHPRGGPRGPRSTRRGSNLNFARGVLAVSLV